MTHTRYCSGLLITKATCSSVSCSRRRRHFESGVATDWPVEYSWSPSPRGSCLHRCCSLLWPRPQCCSEEFFLSSTLSLVCSSMSCIVKTLHNSKYSLSFSCIRNTLWNYGKWSWKLGFSTGTNLIWKLPQQILGQEKRNQVQPQNARTNNCIWEHTQTHTVCTELYLGWTSDIHTRAP